VAGTTYTLFLLPQTTALCIEVDMDLKTFLVLAIYLLCYSPPSYYLLRYLKVESQLYKRAMIFGATIGALQFLVPIAILFINFQFGGYIGVVIGPLLSYFYVKSVLNIKWYKNIAIIVLLPLAAGLVSAPIMYLLLQPGV